MSRPEASGSSSVPVIPQPNGIWTSQNGTRPTLLPKLSSKEIDKLYPGEEAA